MTHLLHPENIRTVTRTSERTVKNIRTVMRTSENSQFFFLFIIFNFLFCVKSPSFGVWMGVLFLDYQGRVLTSYRRFQPERVRGRIISFTKNHVSLQMYHFNSFSQWEISLEQILWSHQTMLYVTGPSRERERGGGEKERQRESEREYTLKN